jgi:hypothetical protein
MPDRIQSVVLQYITVVHCTIIHPAGTQEAGSVFCRLSSGAQTASDINDEPVPDVVPL